MVAIKADFEFPTRPGPSMQDLLRDDTRPVPQILVDDVNEYASNDGDNIDTDCYISPDIYRQEVEHLWGKVWQIACHEDQIQKVGDYIVYDIADKSFIVVRTGPNEIKAYYNACLHRGRMLCEADGHAQNFRCKFHGFMWRLNGELGFVPSRWDFPDLKTEDYHLPEAKVGLWSGFVFINPDIDAGPLKDYLGALPDHFKNWGFENRHVVGHVGQVIRANWKVCVEAFLEFYHGMATHPQILASTSDVNTRYVIRKDHPHYSHMVMPMAVASPFVADQTGDQQILDATFQAMDPTIAPGTHLLPPGQTVRAYYAELKRAQMAQSAGRDFSAVSDSEMIDGWVYSLFPNVALWGAYAIPFWYRFRPWQNQPEMTLMEVFIMPELPKDAPRPPAPKMTLLSPDQCFSDSPELGIQGEFFNQDLGNLEWVQRGLHASKRRTVTLASYQESEIRQFHRTLEAYLRGELPGA